MESTESRLNTTNQSLSRLTERFVTTRLNKLELLKMGNNCKFEGRCSVKTSAYNGLAG